MIQRIDHVTLTATTVFRVNFREERGLCFNSPWKLLDVTRILSITANLGYARTAITHPATATHSCLTDRERTSAEISDGPVRIVGDRKDNEDI